MQVVSTTLLRNKHAKHIGGCYRVVVGGQCIAAGLDVAILMRDNTMCDQPVAPASQQDLAGKGFLCPAGAELQYVTRGDRGQHAATRGTETQPTEAFQHLLRQQ